MSKKKKKDFVVAVNNWRQHVSSEFEAMGIGSGSMVTKDNSIFGGSSKKETLLVVEVKDFDRPMAFGTCPVPKVRLFSLSKQKFYEIPFNFFTSRFVKEGEDTPIISTQIQKESGPLLEGLADPSTLYDTLKPEVVARIIQLYKKQ